MSQFSHRLKPVRVRNLSSTSVGLVGWGILTRGCTPGYSWFNPLGVTRCAIRDRLRLAFAILVGSFVVRKRSNGTIRKGQSPFSTWCGNIFNSVLGVRLALL